MKPTDLTLKFAMLVARWENLCDKTIGALDLGGMSAIPAMFNYASLMQVMNYTMLRDRLNDELLLHYDLLNGVSSVARMITRLNSPEEAQRQIKIPIKYNSVGKITVEQLMVDSFQDLFNRTFEAPDGYKPHDMLAGLVPTVLTPEWNSKDKLSIVDIFEVHKDAFTGPKEPFHQRVSLENGRELRMDFTPQTLCAVESSGWSVECGIYDIDPTGMGQTEKSHWLVRTFFDIIWTGQEVRITPFSGVALPGQLTLLTQDLVHFDGSMAVESPYDIYPPPHYENQDKLSIAVEVYNELENVIHFGTESLIPKDAIRAGIRQFLHRHKYYAIAPTRFLTQEEVAQGFVDLHKATDDHGASILFKKNHSNYAQFTSYFVHDQQCNNKDNGILMVQFDYGSIKNLFELDVIPIKREYLDIRTSSNNVSFQVVCKEGEKPQLLMRTHLLTLGTMSALLSTAIKMTELANTVGVNE